MGTLPDPGPSLAAVPTATSIAVHDTTLAERRGAEADAPTTVTAQINSLARAEGSTRHLARVRHTKCRHGTARIRIDGRVGLWMELRARTNARAAAAAAWDYSARARRRSSVIDSVSCGSRRSIGAGLLHGDVKAHNVMREEGGRTVLMDFGAGKDLDQDVLPMHVPGSHDFAGTPLYVAPEVFAGSRRTKAADVYSLGVLLFHLVTNRYPVEGPTRAAIE